MNYLMQCGPFGYRWFLAGIFCLLLGSNVSADTLELVPFVELQGEYNDNFFFTETSQIDDYITTISPGLSLLSESEILNSGLSARVDRILYEDNDDLNAWDQNYRAWYDKRISPVFRFSAEGEFTRDSRPDRDILTTGLVLTNVERDRVELSIGGDYSFSEKTAASLSYKFLDDEYEVPVFTDSRSHSVNLGFSHRSSPLLTEQLDFGFTQHRFDDSTVDNYTATLGARLAWSEIWDVFFAVGGRLTRSKGEVSQVEFVPPSTVTVVTVDQRDEDWGIVGQGGISYRGELTRATLTLSQDVMTASGRSGATERSSLALSVTRNFTPRLSARLSAAGYLNKSDRGEFTSAEIDEKTFRINPAIRYNFSKNKYIEGSYSYTKVQNETVDTDKDQNMFLIRISLRHSLLG